MMAGVVYATMREGRKQDDIPCGVADTRNAWCGRVQPRRGNHCVVMQRKERMTSAREALRQQRRHVVALYCDTGARRGDVVTSNGTTGKNGGNGHETTQRKAAAAPVDAGATCMRTHRMRAAIPPNQRASDSHDDTRLALSLSSSIYEQILASIPLPRDDCSASCRARPLTLGAAAWAVRLSGLCRCVLVHLLEPLLENGRNAIAEVVA